MKQTGIRIWHPAVSGCYFAAVLAFSAMVMHPAYLLVSLCGATWNLRVLSGGKSTWRAWRTALPLFILTALINAAFNHRGMTILWYFPSGNPLTLESLFYGAAAGALLVCVLLWMRCLTLVFTTDRWLYLFGAVMPTLALLLSMSLRFVGLFVRRFRTVQSAQAGLQTAKPKGRLRTAFSAFPIMLNWSLESAVTTADSMKSRGYATARRTAMRQYRFTGRDRLLLCWILLCLFSLVSAAAGGLLRFGYFPVPHLPAANVRSVYFILLYFLLCLTPVLAGRGKGRLWTC